MHLAQISPRHGLCCQAKDITKTYQQNLYKVGKGWFSLSECRERGWLFWSHYRCMFG